jgi:hypothetical protein
VGVGDGGRECGSVCVVVGMSWCVAVGASEVVARCGGKSRCVVVGRGEEVVAGCGWNGNAFAVGIDGVCGECLEDRFGVGVEGGV